MGSGYNSRYKVRSDVMRVLEIVSVSHTESSAQRVEKDVPRAAILVRRDCESRSAGSVQRKQAACRGSDNVPHPSLVWGRKHDKQTFGASTLLSLHLTIITFGKALMFKCIPLVPFSPFLKVQWCSQLSPAGYQTALFSTPHTCTGCAKVHADCCCRHWPSLSQSGLIFYSTQELHSSRKHL